MWEDYGGKKVSTDRGLDGGEDGDGEVAAEEGVGDEAAEEAEHEGGAHEVGDDVGGLGVAQVHGAREVRHQVHGDAQRGQPLVQLRHCSSTTDTGQESGQDSPCIISHPSVRSASIVKEPRASELDRRMPPGQICLQSTTYLGSWRRRPSGRWWRAGPGGP